MNIAKSVPGTLFSLLLASGALLAQAPPAFEVATVKPSAPLDPVAIKGGTAHIGTRIDASRVDIGTASLFRLICTAYRLKPYQVSAPDWLKNANFDVQAKIPVGVSADQVPEMLRTLLIERFGLKTHIDAKDQSVYALVVAPGGIRMKESASEPPPPPPPAGAPAPLEILAPTLQGDVKLTRTAQGIGIEMPDGEISGKIRATPKPGTGSQPMRLHLESSGTTMKAFAAMLSVGVVDHPVVDKTGLTGAYEVAVDITEDDAMKVARGAITFLPTGGGGDGAAANPGGMPGANLAAPSGSSIMSSIESLGLKLEPRKLPLDLLVIEHIEKTPTSN